MWLSAVSSRRDRPCKQPVPREAGGATVCSHQSWPGIVEDCLGWKIYSHVSHCAFDLKFTTDEMFFYICLTVDSAVGGFEKRTPSATLSTHWVPGCLRWTERFTAVWSCSSGAEETLPGAAGKSLANSCQLWITEFIQMCDTVCRRLVTVITWSRATSWPRTRSYWTRGTLRWL